MLSSKNKTNYETYIKLLKDENEKLYRKIPQLQKDLDHAIAAKEKSSALLNKYKSEYESLIADAKKLMEKQKKQIRRWIELWNPTTTNCKSL